MQKIHFLKRVVGINMAGRLTRQVRQYRMEG